MKYLKITFFLLGVVFLHTSSVFAQQTVTLRAALDSALRNNLQVKQAMFQGDLTEQDVLQAKMNLFPSITASVAGQRNWGLVFDQTAGRLINSAVTSGNAGMNANLVVFGGFQKINQISMNKYRLLSNQNNIEKVKNDLILSVVTKYLEALTNKDLLTAAQQQVALSKEQLDVQQYNYDVGNKTLADLSQAKSQLAIDELSMTTAQNGYDLSILDLKQLMEMNPITDIVLEKPPLPDVDKLVSAYVAEDVYQEAVKRYPDIKVAEANTLVAQKNIAISKGALYPQLTIGAGYNTNYSSQSGRVVSTNPIVVVPLSFGRQLDENRGQNIFASLSIPIFNNYQRTINLKKAKISYENALNDEHIARNNLNKVINQAVLDLRAAEKKYHSNEINFKSASDAFDVIKQRYEVGLANAVELTTQQTAMNKAEFDFIQSRYDFIFKSKVIDFYLGRSITFN